MNLKRAVFILTLFTLSNISLYAQNLVVVELFTSQGCSSCPRADQLLSRLVEEENTQVIGLSFHVDYWDRLGWKDPYSNRDFTQRQQDYAQAFGSRQVYTPQMIVDGTVEFVGSSETKAREALNRASKKDKNRFNLKTTRSGESVEISYGSISSEYNNMILNIALVEKDLTTQVKRGENGGRVLHHDNVVRSFESLKLNSESGSAKLTIPEDLIPSNASVIAYIQDPGSMKVLGVVSVEFE